MITATEKYAVLTVFLYTVHPAHIAFVLLSEGQGEAGASTGSHPLFASVIDKAGGDLVSHKENVPPLYRTDHDYRRPPSAVGFRSSLSESPPNPLLPKRFLSAQPP